MKELAGRVGVDSGMILICDPAHLGRPRGVQSIEAVLTGKRRISGIESVRAGSTDISLGALVKTFGGDGLYPIWVEKDKAGRIKSLTVIFEE